MPAPQPVPFDRLGVPKTYLCHRAPYSLPVDGSLSDPAWKRAAWTDDFVDIEGDTRPSPRFRTRAKMLWDDRFLYVGAELEEPDVWATLVERDSIIFHDNDFEIFIDPDGDNHNYFEIEINALNTVWDLRLPKPYRDGGPALSDWDARGMKSAVEICGTLNEAGDSDEGWTVELAIPWESVCEFAGCPAPPRENDQWRVNFSRVEWSVEASSGGYRKIEGRREDNWVWTPQGVVDMHRPEMWGYVQFTSAEPGTGLFLPDPSWQARVRLLRLYYAQREYEEQTGRWATDPQALGCCDIDMVAVQDGYAASTAFVDREGKTRFLTIRQDSRLTIAES